MARLTKIYTRKGDRGQTGLGTGERVRKDDPQVESYGTVDELNSQIGVAIASGLSSDVEEELTRVQSELFNLAGELCLLPRDENGEPAPSLIEARHIEALERACDRFNADLGHLQNFILPGGSPGAAQLHLARTVCRRAERRLLSFAGESSTASEPLRYLNRLSDLLFILARYENRQRGVGDVPWDTSV